MNKVQTQYTVMMDGLESRLLMHGGGRHGGLGADAGFGGGDGGGGGGRGGEGGVGIFMPTTPNAAVTADLTKLQTDQQAFGPTSRP